MLIFISFSKKKESLLHIPLLYFVIIHSFSFYSSSFPYPFYIFFPFPFPFFSISCHCFSLQIFPFSFSSPCTPSSTYSLYFFPFFSNPSSTYLSLFHCSSSLPPTAFSIHIFPPNLPLSLTSLLPFHFSLLSSLCHYFSTYSSILSSLPTAFSAHIFSQTFLLLLFSPSYFPPLSSLDLY